MCSVATLTPTIDSALSLTESLWRFGVDDYHLMVRTGILGESDRVELLEGMVIEKVPHNPPHDAAIDLLQELIRPYLPPGWRLRIQSAITTSDSEPEPDLVLAEGDARAFATRHPAAADIAIVVEVADSSLAVDRGVKSRLYARAGIPVYWLLNLVERQLEVHEDPSGPSEFPMFRRRRVLRSDDLASLDLRGNRLAELPVSQMLP